MLRWDRLWQSGTSSPQSAEVQPLKGRTPGVLTENCDIISQLFVLEHATKNQPITYIRLEAVIISQLILLSHIFTIRLTTATCSTNGGIIVECGWKAGWEYPTSPLEMNLARCQIQRDAPCFGVHHILPSWEKEDLRWTAEHVSMLATKRPFFFLTKMLHSARIIDRYSYSVSCRLQNIEKTRKQTWKE